ncbi:hypothetical protein F4778DRAFT_368632 [Xylariomycetidae sp. FL2044]|nr:hypothetical protein F4778DRAFT_368632 [Xylariomycetidae sp. FL2044]
MAKTLRLGDRLRYPITIAKLLKKPGDDVVKQETILNFTYTFERTVGDPTLGEERVVEETGIADWDSPAEGKVKQWKVKEGDVISRDQPLITIEETCSHEIQVAGLCAMCGKDMKEQNWATRALDTERATVAMVHDNTALTVSQNQAERAEMQLQRRLLKDRKLSLVVDLDQTIIHACIEPTVGEWQRDPSNPNHDAVKEVRSFQLDDGPRGLASGCWYYIKMRPGLAEFLDRVSELFELHVYTMGTRAYALNIAKIVDPTQKLFGNRVISRDENGSMTAKSLQRLFPVSTNMVVVIDDRADVWPRNRSNLIKVTPYDFFKGIGDINSSFLPKREDIIVASPAPAPEPQKSNGTTPQGQQANAGQAQPPGPQKSAAETEDESTLLQLQAEEQERTLEKQLTDRPLLHLQEKLDREEEEAERTTPENGDTPESSPMADSDSQAHHRHNILRDDDEELEYLEKHLTNLHHAFYEQYDARSANRRPDDIAPDVVPDVGSTLNYLKSQVLKGTSIVLSGLVPLGVDVRRSEIGLHAESFGATIRTRVSSEISHLVISSSRPRTQKVRQAARISSIKIVNQNWLADSLARWEKLDETPYLIQVHPADRAAQTPLDDEEEEEGSASPPRPPRITIVQNGNPVFQNENHGDADDGDAEDSGEDDEDGDDGDDDDGDGDRYAPPELEDGQHSPIDDFKDMKWGEIDDELREMLGSDADDSDFESTQGTDQETDGDGDGLRNMKRKIGDVDGGDSEAEAAGSVLAKKQRMAKARTTGLRNVKNAGEDDGDGSGLPTPMVTGDEEDARGESKAGNHQDGDGDMDMDEEEEEEDVDDLEDALAAELAAEGQG